MTTTPYPQTLTLDEIKRLAHTEGDLRTVDLITRLRDESPYTEEDLQAAHAEEDLQAAHAEGYDEGYADGEQA